MARTSVARSGLQHEAAAPAPPCHLVLCLSFPAAKVRLTQIFPHICLRPEEHWRPARSRDLSKYKARHPTINEETGEVYWEHKQATIDRVASELRASGTTRKGTQLDLKAGCGIEGPLAREDRIVGGVEATEHTWPWQVALFIDDAWFCGGSIISENYVLTAAHCADGAGYFDVMAGAHNVRASSEPHRVEVTSYNGWTHPQWNEQDLSNDLALVELPSPLPMSNYITTSCLPAAGDVPSVGTMASVTGWGKPSDSAGGISDVLREVRDVPIMSNADCNDVYGIVGDGVICIDTTGGRGSCNVRTSQYFQTFDQHGEYSVFTFRATLEVPSL